MGLEFNCSEMGKLIYSHLVTLRRIGVMSLNHEKVVIEDDFSERLFLRREFLPKLNFPGFKLIHL